MRLIERGPPKVRLWSKDLRLLHEGEPKKKLPLSMLIAKRVYTYVKQRPGQSIAVGVGSHIIVCLYEAESIE
jgi:hypothetical protein